MMLPQSGCECGWQLRVDKQAHDSGGNQDGVIQIARGVSNTSADVLDLEIGVVGEDFLFGHTRGKHVQHILDADSHAADARSSTTLVGIDGDALEFVHPSK